jgi:hypothetical protein
VGIFEPDLAVGTGADSGVTEVNRARQMKQEARKSLKILNTAMSTMALHTDTQCSGKTFETKREIEAIAVQERPRRLNVKKNTAASTTNQTKSQQFSGKFVRENEG